MDGVWTIEPGVAVGPFRLGDSIAEVLHALKSRLPVRPLEIIYDSLEPFKAPVLIDSPEDGLKLRLDPITQVLTRIEFFEVNKVPLKYGRVVIFGGDVAATFMSIYNLFGPTFPGSFDPDQQSYFLGYDGACFRFPIPAEYVHLYRDKNDLPLEFPNGTTPAATQVMVFVGNNHLDPKLPTFRRRHYYEETVAEIGDKSVVVKFKSRKQQIELGWSPQEVMSEIGAPVSVFRKHEDPDDASRINGGCIGDYFHNYPHLGIDVMYNSLHAAAKIILKTNALGHPEFGSYQKCNYRLCFLTSPALQKTGMKKVRIPEISPETPWKDIQKLFGGGSDDRPIVRDNGLGLHPFGSTLCYTPVQGCTFEVMKNGFVASVTLST
ncbi:hypothetical protein PINS_up001482 [Pythium insidiosum]|nr:hypothetical protein PINS_up001482 [Pythium insidiosum]